MQIFFYILLALAAGFLVPDTALAYIGPGAGFAFLGSTFVFFLSAGMLMVTVLFWPFQWTLRRIRGKGIPKTAKSRRVVIVGLDGLEPKLVDKYIAEGRLPNLKALAEEGGYARLGTTLPALSPVAWSTFQTGVNPGAHNIFDFLTRDKRHCLPLLSSTVTEAGKRVRRFGPFSFKTDAPSIRILRRSKPFWKVLGDYGIFSNVVRVPISYPPEPFYGNLLSAMCTPDLRGSQGTFSFFSSKFGSASSSDDGATTGGDRQPLIEREGSYRGELIGPTVNGKTWKVAFELKPAGDRRALLKIDGSQHELRLNEFSGWIEIIFNEKRKKVSGIARFCLRGLEPSVDLYVSPININPERPAMPIGHPLLFPVWLAKRLGPYGTLGLLEDTWGRNEQAIDDRRFLDHTWLNHEERERMFFDVLERTREGVCICVFDASDRIQHMFWRYIDEGHPAKLESEEFRDVLPQMYARMDDLVGRTRAKLRAGDVLIVLSDHGFTSFKRGINLNTWLKNEGYLVLKEGAAHSGEYFEQVDWSRTKAYAIGLSGLYINRAGRESQGIVDANEAQRIVDEIGAKLEALKDPQNGAQAILKVYQAAKCYKGLYTGEAPDLIVGYAPGYRVSWESVTGAFEPEVFSDNVKAWSGDHGVDPASVPGILLSNRPITASRPHIADIAPTVLGLFAIPVPQYMEGKPLF